MGLQSNIVGIDVGGTKIHAAAVYAQGKLARQALVPTPKDKDDAISTIIQLAQTLRDCGTIAIGIAVPGPVDIGRGVVVELPNLKGWKNVAFAKVVTKATGLACTVENDAKCFLLAELAHGAAFGKKNAVGVIMGTGFGSAIAINGEIYRGAHGSAGEIGHTIISEKSGALGFRNEGELESFASGRAISAMAGGRDAKAVFESARKGDAKAKKIIEQAAFKAGIGFANIINTLDPEIIVVGGSLSNSLPQMIPQIRKVIMRDCFSPANRIPIVRHKLGHPGVVGAAVAAFKGLNRT
jgi:predicted NBD/HSP70 family sugar kinase